MARVPTANQPLEAQGVQPGYQQINAPAAAFGSLQAEGAMQGAERLGRFANDLTRRALEAQQFDNERALKQADVALADKIRTITYGDGTTNNPGYFSLRGDNAINQSAATLQALQAAHDEVMQTLPNDRTREIFASLGKRRVVAEQEAVGRFVGQQRTEANNGASMARMDAAVNDAATRWNEPQALQQAIAVMNGEVADFARRNGLGPDAAQQALRDQYGKLLSNVIKAAGRVDPNAAVKIFEDNRNLVPGTALAAIEREMKTDLEFKRRADEHAMVMADRAAAKAATDRYNTYISPAIDPDNPNGIDLHAVANDPVLAKHPELKVALYRFAAAQDKAEPLAQVSAQTVQDIYPRINLDDGDPNKITDVRQIDELRAAKKLNSTDYKFLRDTFTDASDPKVRSFGASLNNLITAMSKTIQGGSSTTGLPDPNRAINAARYIQDVTTLLKGARERGENLADYANPNSPKYIASPAMFQNYQRSMQDILQDTIKGLNRPTGAGVGGVTVPTPETYKSLDDLKAALGAKRITRAEAERIAREKGWIQ